MPQLEVRIEQIEKLINQLDSKDKMKLVQKLESKTIPLRWKMLLHRINLRRKRSHLTQHDIEKIVEVVREEVHERNCR